MDSGANQGSESGIERLVAMVIRLADGHLFAKRLAPIQLTFYAKPKLLVLDEVGYLPFEKRSAHLFFQLVARRYERGSILVTTNQPVIHWGTVFGDEILAAAILDRLLHRSHIITIQGDSYRLRQKKRAGLLSGTNTKA